jgi:hypothetical protein
MNLWESFLNQPNYPSVKWTHYFPIYEKHFEKYRNRTLTFLEIGTYLGGSSHMWSRYFGPLSTIVSIDNDPSCKQYEKNNIHIRIGDQSDHNFLQSVIDEFGIPDVVLDDGSHRHYHINSSFQFLYPKMPYNSIYMVEDLHTSYQGWFDGSLNNPDTFLNKCKGYIDQIHINHTAGQVQKDPTVDGTYSMSVYDSIVVFEKQKPYTYKGIWSTGEEINDA